MCNGEGVVVGSTWHTDDEVDVRSLQHAVSLLRRRDLCERRRIAHAQFRVLVEQLLVDTTIVLQHEGIVGVGDNQHIEDALRHQVDEADIFQEEVIELLRYVRILHFSLFHYPG